MVTIRLYRWFQFVFGISSEKLYKWDILSVCLRDLSKKKIWKCCPSGGGYLDIIGTYYIVAPHNIQITSRPFGK